MYKKSAKPALCTPRIAKAILAGVPLLYEHFPITQKSAKPALCTPRIAITISNIILFSDLIPDTRSHLLPALLSRHLLMLR